MVHGIIMKDVETHRSRGWLGLRRPSRKNLRVQNVDTFVESRSHHLIFKDLSNPIVVACAVVPTNRMVNLKKGCQFKNPTL